MNRRRFLELLGTAIAGTAVVYSFPSIIVPKNIAAVSPSYEEFLRQYMHAAYKRYNDLNYNNYNIIPRGLVYLIDHQDRVLQGITAW